jgi:thioredoxin 1
MSAVKVNDENFESEVLKSDGPVVVDFWAEWCGPCKALSPVIEEVAGEMGDKVKIVKINIDESPNTPTQYGVRGIPTLMIFREGQVVDTRVGGMAKGQLTDWIESMV